MSAGFFCADPPAPPIVENRVREPGEVLHPLTGCVLMQPPVSPGCHDMV